MRSAGALARPRARSVLVAVLAALSCGCGPAQSAHRNVPPRPPVAGRPEIHRERPAVPREDRFLDDLEQRTFQWFWDTANPSNGLIPDRWPTPSFSSIAATGFGLTAYPIGVERGYVTRTDAAARTRLTLEFLRDLPQGPAATGVAGYHGFFYHFLDMGPGLRFQNTELSTVDTALLMGGVITCREYFDGSTPDEVALRAAADTLVARVEWDWAQTPHPPAISHGWLPESGWLPNDWRGYNEAMIVYVLALGSPTHPVGVDAWAQWTAPYVWSTFHGQEFLQFAPLFGHQFTHVWVDFRGIADAFMRARGIDYFENSRRAALSQQQFAIDNPGTWKGYSKNVWGVTACDGPADGTFTIDGQSRRFMTYAGRGAGADFVQDDGTIAPYGAGAALPFVGDVALDALREMKRRGGDDLYGRYGFFDAFNVTFTLVGRNTAGKVVPGVGWFDTDYLGIDQGPLLAMIENHRSGLVWRLTRGNDVIVRGLVRAGFTGGWIDRR